MTDPIPLPEPDLSIKDLERHGISPSVYTAATVRSLIAAARAQALEDAARAVETQETNGDHVGGWFELLAAKLRAIKAAVASVKDDDE